MAKVPSPCRPGDTDSPPPEPGCDMYAPRVPRGPPPASRRSPRSHRRQGKASHVQGTPHLGTRVLGAAGGAPARDRALEPSEAQAAPPPVGACVRPAGPCLPDSQTGCRLPLQSGGTRASHPRSRGRLPLRLWREPFIRISWPTGRLRSQGAVGLAWGEAVCGQVQGPEQTLRVARGTCCTHRPDCFRPRVPPKGRERFSSRISEPRGQAWVPLSAPPPQRPAASRTQGPKQAARLTAHPTNEETSSLQ